MRYGKKAMTPKAATKKPKPKPKKKKSKRSS